jgi:glycine/D-amino acid oxidase-like deaminating enzyme
MARRHGRPAAIAMRRAMNDTVHEVGRVAEAEGIECDWALGGTVVVARTAAQLQRARTEVAHDVIWGGVDGFQLLDATDTVARVGIRGALGATYAPHCARVHPAKLVRGLARVVEVRGGRIAEGTRALAINQGPSAPTAAPSRPGT